MNQSGVLQLVNFPISLACRAATDKTRFIIVAALLASACMLAPAPAHAAIPQSERNALLDFYNGTNGAGWRSSSTAFSISTITRDGTTDIVTLAFTGQTSWTTGYSIVVSGVQQAANVDVFDGTYTISTISYNSTGNLTTLTYTQSSGNTGSGTSGTGTVTNSSGGSTGTSGWTGAAGTECSWYGVTCNAGQTSVTGITLSGNGLRGSLAPSLGNLTNLLVLNLSDNNLSGSIPAALDNLTSLQVLNLSSNQLSGQIPSLPDLRTSLQVLDLSVNQLTGSIPASLGSLANLQQLYLSANQLSGSIPASLGSLTNLQKLYMSANHLTGSLLPWLGGLTSLQELVLFSNELASSIPETIGNLASLQKLVLFGNQLNGPLPASLGNLTKLQDVVLSDNQLNGQIPSSLGNLASLLLLDLSINQLSGQVPSSLGNLKSLLVLDLSANQLVGQVPSSLTNLVHITRLGIAYNALYAMDSALSGFLDRKEPGWENTQTVTPTGITVTVQSDSSINVSWVPIAYTGYSGRYEVWSSTTEGGPYTFSGATVDKSSSSFLLTNLVPATYYVVVQTVTDPSPSDSNTVVSGFSAEVSASIGAEPSLNLALASGGATAASTFGTAGTTQAGYATVAVNSGAAPYGTAVFDYTQNGTTVSEAAVPASPPTTSALFFVDYRTGVTLPGSTGKVDIYTGYAAANMGSGAASIKFTLRGLDGKVLASGNDTLAKGAHVSRYVNQLPGVIPGFSIPASFPTSTYFGTLQLTSDQPLSIVALRLTTNQRGDTLLTSTPIADLTRQPTSNPTYFPQLADGGGYTTTVILMNTAGAAESGTLTLRGDDGLPLSVRPVNGSSGSTFAYSIPSGGAYVFQTDASPAATNAGWVMLTPDSGTSAPVGAGVFQYIQSGILVTESGIPSSMPTTHARIFVDTSAGHDTGLALANPAGEPVNVSLAAFQVDGATPAGMSPGSVTISADGHTATFVDQQISGLPANFRGVLDIAGNSPFVALTLRSLINQRGEFLLTTFPVADMNQPAPSPIIFPQIADGGGFTTEFILLSAGAADNTTLSFFGDSGASLSLGLSH